MKNELRQIAKQKRVNFDVKQLSFKIKTNLFASDIYKNSQNIMCYYSIGSEIETLDYFSDESKNWFLPRVYGENMLACPYSSTLVKNSYNIPEPTSEPVDTCLLDMIIIPALCVDKNGYRIGYGKGYYDKFIKSLSKPVFKVVLAYSELFIDNIYPDSFDEKCDYVVTENGLFKI